MAPITNLYCQYAYPDVGSSFPICILMHGFGDSATNFTAATMKRIAQYGLFVAAVGMRGRNGASGAQDASGREIYDIYDVIGYIRTNYASKIDPDHVGIVGYSGGGGNVLAALCKFPDTFTLGVTHFGMSDYGRNNPDGWYYNGGNPTTLDTWIGGSPIVAPNNYFSRDATYAIGKNFSGGKLLIYHDVDDASVPVIHSERIEDTMVADNRTNYEISFTDSNDNPRWLHGYPNVGDTGEPCIQTELTWAVELATKQNALWSVPVAGTMFVIGYINTKRFEIRLGTLVDEVAIVDYDTTLDTYTVTPQTGTMDVTITQGIKTITQTINSPTVLIVV